MAYLGRFQLGQTVPLYLQCESGTHAPTLPDAPPNRRVFSGTTLIEARQIPINDRYVVTGLFRDTLFLSRLYTTGFYEVVYSYQISGTPYARSDNFEVVGGGDGRGAAVSTYFYDRPEARYVVQGLESGSIIKGRNPTV